jgi:hypothetical protein
MTDYEKSKLKERCRCGRVIRGGKFAFCPICRKKQLLANERLLESKRLKVSRAALYD